jgi:isocitrate/isopropylmalate dehydrogenase
VQAVAKKQGFEIEWKEALIGGAALDACNDPCPDETLAQMKASDSVLLAAIGTNPSETSKSKSASSIVVSGLIKHVLGDRRSQVGWKPPRQASRDWSPQDA